MCFFSLISGSKQDEMEFISRTRIAVNKAEINYRSLVRAMKIEEDEFEKMVHNIRSMLDLLLKILQQTPGAAALDENQKHTLLQKILQQTPDAAASLEVRENTIISKLLRVVDLLDTSKGNDIITLQRMQAMDVLREIEKAVYGLFFGLDLEVNLVDLMILRPNELEEIASLLVKDSFSTTTTPVSVFPIVGMPASGRSSLAYLLFYHQKIKEHFNSRIWINWKLISGVNCPKSILKIVQRKIYGDAPLILQNFKILIVLDGFFSEEWFELLVPLLSAFAHSEPGSKLVVTSTSTSLQPHVVPLQRRPLAKASPYLLGPLHHDNLLSFFRTIAFRGIPEEHKDNTDLNNIAIRTFNRCNNNLHVIRITASILCSQPPPRWEYFNQVVLNIPDLHKRIYSIRGNQKFFNHHLLFPLDYEFSKLQFYHLWDDSHKKIPQNFEMLLGDEFLFQCCKRDKSGVIVKYKVQALALEVMKHLARHEYLLVDDYTQESYISRPLHVNFIVNTSWRPSPQLNDNFYHDLKSLYFYPRKSCQTLIILDLSSILHNKPNLQALDLAIVDCRNSLVSISKLKNLRYLRLGVSSESLPECITDLKLLQTLDLRHSKVRELPAGFHKLCNLRFLYVGDRLVDLPPKFGELTKLQTLDVFIVGQHNGLVALANFTHFHGTLKVRYQEGREAHVIPHQDAIILQDTQLHELSLEWPSSNATHQPAAENYQTEEAIQLELLQPPSTLKSLIIKCWNGEEFPKWAMDNFSLLLSNLVFIHIADCNQCTHLPSLSKLGCLKSLHLWGLIAVEWIENCVDNKHSISYFPSLENLSLLNLPMLKGWSRPSTVTDNQHVSHQILPRLNDLRVSRCLDLISLPLMPNLQSLEVDNCHGDFLQQFLSAHASSAPLLFRSLRSLKLMSMSIPERLDCLTALEELSLCWLYDLRILPESIGHLTQLCRLVIRYVPNLVDLPESLAGLFGLEHIEIRYCPRLKQIPRYFSQLVSLQKLKIKECVNLERRCQEPNGEDWPLIKHIRKVHMG